MLHLNYCYRERVYTGSRLIPVDVTHSSSSVKLVPAAENEAGLSIIHPEHRQRDKQKETQTGRFMG